MNDYRHAMHSIDIPFIQIIAIRLSKLQDTEDMVENLVNRIYLLTENISPQERFHFLLEG